ncbi:MAG: hypothetical protein WCW64_00935 [Phycisphaerae bacterium]|jgi:hypothetical protein
MSEDNEGTFYDIIKEKSLVNLVLWSLILPLRPLSYLIKKQEEVNSQQRQTLIKRKWAITVSIWAFKAFEYGFGPVFLFLFFLSYLNGIELFGNIKSSGLSMLKAYVAIPVGALMFQVLFTLAINCLTGAIIIVFEYRCILKRTFSESIKEELGNYLIWSKLWAGPKSHALLDTLKNDNNVEKSKWLMVNFLNKIVENSQIENSQITYQMPLWEYSQFISANITHAQKMSWRVSSKDFFGLFMPRAIMFALVEIGLRRVGVSLTNCSDTVTSCIPKATGKLYKHIKTEKINWEDDKGRLYGKDSDQYKEIHMIAMEEFIIPICFCEGLDFLKKAENPIDIICNAEEIYKKIDREGMNYPHVESFRQAKSNKSRTITLGTNVQDKDHENTLLINAINDRWYDHKEDFDQFFKTLRKRCPEDCVKSQDCIESLKNEVKQKLINEAIEFFVHSCGGKDFLKISGRSHKDNIDIGLYDEKISIESSSIESASLPPNGVHPGGIQPKISLGKRKVTIKYDNTKVIDIFQKLTENVGSTEGFIELCKKVVKIG